MALSPDPRKRQRQLGNLVPGARTAPPGNRRAVRHGGYATVAAERMEAKVAEVYAAVASDAPLRDVDGGLPAADAAAVHLLAEALCRLEDVSANVRDRGLLDDAGNVRPVVELEGRLRREVADHLDSLGMTPRSRARLGLDVARGFDLAEAWAASALDVPEESESEDRPHDECGDRAVPSVQSEQGDHGREPGDENDGEGHERESRSLLGRHLPDLDSTDSHGGHDA